MKPTIAQPLHAFARGSAASSGSNPAREDPLFSPYGLATRSRRVVHLRLWINGAHHRVLGLRCSRFAAAFVGYAARVSESVSMRFPPQFLDELRARLPVSEVVGRRVKLKKQGREFVGLSPFNEEKTPSFTVNDQKGFFHDFSSGSTAIFSTSSWRPKASLSPRRSNDWPHSLASPFPNRRNNKKPARNTARPCTTSWASPPPSLRRHSPPRGAPRHASTSPAAASSLRCSANSGSALRPPNASRSRST